MSTSAPRKHVPNLREKSGILTDEISSRDQPSAYGYIRVSTSMQAEEGISLVTQSNRIAEYCKFRGYNLVKIYEDAGLSGGNANRPGLTEVLSILKKGDYLVVAELSRLSRNSSDAVKLHTQFREKGIKLVSLNPDIDFSTAVGEMMYNVLVAIYQLERRQTAERVSVNMKTLSAQGKLRPRPPFGWKFVSKEFPFEEVEEQQEIIDYIFILRGDGLSLHQICAYLNAEGYNKVLGGGKHTQQFYPQTVKNIIQQNMRNYFVE